MKPNQKGVLELCVLSLLSRRDHCGYEVSNALAHPFDIGDGAVYPILRKLKNDGLISAYLLKDGAGPPRTCYALTRFGRDTYETNRAGYLAFAKTIKTVLEGNGNDET